MEGTSAPVDLDAVRLYRLGRVRAQLKRFDYAGVLLYDQLNTRYATDATNMQLWCLHNEARYTFVPTEGPVVAFEYGPHKHLLEGLHGVDEIRPTTSWYYFAAGPRFRDRLKTWAAEIGDLVRQYGGGNKRIAVDRMGVEGVGALQQQGLEVRDAWEVMETAREIKSAEELVLMRKAVDVCEQAMTDMRAKLTPGITENALWAQLHETNIRLGGEWIETRLLSAGPRTNPWFRESSMRPIQAGEIMSFDTDMIGPYGYCADISRSWLCGDGKPSDEQRRVYSLAVAQIRHNESLLKPGLGFREFAEKSWEIPEEFLPNRYGSAIHGVGLCDEWPFVGHKIDWERKGNDGHFEEGMTVCVESYMGSIHGGEGVKLEEQVLITADGCERLSQYPLEEDWL
jgi:Xaa-Pro dipeptidase